MFFNTFPKSAFYRPVFGRFFVERARNGIGVGGDNGTKNKR